MNRYLYGGALNFGYVPVYGKFAWFNKLDPALGDLGVGRLRRDVDRGDRPRPGRTGQGVQEHRADAERRRSAAASSCTDWLTVNFAHARLHPPRQVRAADRDAYPECADARCKANADSALVNNFMLYAGVGMYLPTKFTLQDASLTGPTRGHADARTSTVSLSWSRSPR